MLVCRYADAGRYGYGRIEPGSDTTRVRPVRYHPTTRSWVDAAGPVRRLGDVTLLPPAEPSKIVCLALNWRAGSRSSPAARTPPRAANVAVVLKPSTSLAGPGGVVPHPGPDWELRHEAELAAVIGVPCCRVTAAQACDVIAGYTVANDITAYARSAPHAEDRPPIWAKHFDGCTPLGPWLATDLDPTDVELTCRVGDDIRQHGNTRDLLAPVAEVISLVSEHMTLLPGDVVLTGTPPGSRPLSVGDQVEVSATAIGALRHTVSHHAPQGKDGAADDSHR